MSGKDNYSIRDLFKSIKVRHYFNDMKFNDFYKMAYKYIDFKELRRQKITKKDWAFTGLMNTDFFLIML
jgi:hypothetical protein